MTAAPDDATLAAAAAARRGAANLAAAQAAFAELYARHARAVAAFVASRVRGADADDVHQTVWAKAWDALPDKFRDGHFRGWVFQIARNALIDRGRRIATGGLTSASRPDDYADSGPSAAAELIAREEREQLAKCLAKLPPPLADLIRGRLGGADYDDLCRDLKLTPPQAHKLFFEAKAKLTECVHRTNR